ncbi:AF4/FMR2 family member 1-like [Centroberyx affinis]|uniref:AF4/FMR2 family member 1-like n=1 Tax=Centroberyx affinis TaxID=166261 RepID=UPI003A5C68A4
MSSQPSLYNEERNLLRIRAWEQRNQETSQAKDLNPENVPLFGEPYKTNKGDELSSRIQKMLGSYEDVNNPSPSLGSFVKDPLSISTHVTLSQLDQGQPNRDKSAKPPFHNHTQSQKGPSNNSSHSSQPMTKSTVPAAPNHHGPSSTNSQASLNHSQGGQLSHSAQQQRKSEAFPDFKECTSLPRVLSALSPDAEPLPSVHSSDHGNYEPKDTDNKDTCERHQHHGTPDHPLESPSTMDVSPLDPQKSPKDASLPQANKGTTLPSQTFPPLLAYKAPNIVMTQKPTAYVRPMDGQDQVVNESPELKPSPEPYVPLPDLIINKSNLAKLKILPPFLETKTNEAQCVEDILREMTHSWPPLLTAIHTPSTAEPSKSPFPAKEAEHVSSAFPEQKHNNCSPTAPSSISQPSSSLTVEAAHSSGVESASSSDSDSSSGSASDSESGTEQPPQPIRSSSTQTKPDVPTVTHGDWQLGNWIRSSQQNSSTESQGETHASESPIHKQLLATQSSKATKGEVANPTGEIKPRLSSLQNEFCDNHAKPQQSNEGPPNNYSQQSGHKSPSTNSNTHTNSRKTSGSKHPSKPAKAACPEDPQGTLQEKSVEVVATCDKDPSFTNRPKVKTKTGHCKNSSDSTCLKTDSKKAAKYALFDKRKAESEPGPKVTLVLNGCCPSCGVRSPSPCSCLTPSPAKPDQLSPNPPVKISCSKVKTETISQKRPKKPHKRLCPPAHQYSAKLGFAAKTSQDPHRPRESLLMKINLSLLSRVPQASSIHQETPSSGERLPLATWQDRGDIDAFTTLAKTSKKSILPNAEVDYKTLPRKKQRLEKESKITPLSHASTKPEGSSNAAEDRARKKAKKDPVPLQQPPTPRDTPKGSEVHKHCSRETQESGMGAVKSSNTPVKRKKSTGKHTEHSKVLQKARKSTFAIPPPSQPSREALTTRPLLRFEDRKYPVKHYMKEAKKLKHKADAEADKLSKALNYLDAAMYFVESGIAMEIDPKTPMSSYTMFAETVELLKFVLKLKKSVEPSVPPSEKDFLVLCMKCQALLQIAMFRCKHKIALKYSKTLTDHFNSSAKPAQDLSLCASKSTDTPSPMSDMPSPASTASSSGPGSNHSGGGAGGLAVGPVSSTVAIPQVIQQVAVSYVNITTLFLSAHEIWEQAEELAHRGSGFLSELDTAMGPLSLTSSISSLVRYTRQGVHWLRLDSQKVK